MSFQSELMTAMSGVCGGRVYPNIAPEASSYPLVNYRILSKSPVVTIHSTVPAVDFTVIFECWGRTYASALDTADLVRAAVIASGLDYSPMDEQGEDYEAQADSYMEPVYYTFLHQ
jgi:hypothetical protein